MPAVALGAVVLEGSAAATPPPIGTHPAAAATPREAVPAAPPHRQARRADQLILVCGHKGGGGMSWIFWIVDRVLMIIGPIQSWNEEECWSTISVLCRAAIPERQ